MSSFRTAGTKNDTKKEADFFQSPARPRASFPSENSRSFQTSFCENLNSVGRGEGGGIYKIKRGESSFYFKISFFLFSV